MAIPITTLAYFNLLTMKDDLSRPELGMTKTTTLCLTRTPSTTTRGPEPTTLCTDRTGQLAISSENSTYTASHTSTQFIPKLSLFPFSGPPDEGYKITVDTKNRLLYTRTDDIPTEEKARFDRTQNTVNGLVLATTATVLGMLSVFGAVVWTATARVLRPVEAIRREMADITEHDLTRRVPVPRTRNEIAALANTVNATLDRLETAVQDNRRFVADASHELRSPIAALRAELEIATTHPGQADWPAVVDAALADTHRLQDLAGDLLLLTRLDHTTTGYDGTVDLTELVRDHTDRRRTHHTLDVDLPDHPVPVRGSRPLLDRLLGNLLDNAERHATTAITVRLDAADDQAVLEVLDDGPGIPPEDRERVFDRFTRLDDARTRDTGGTGLGLSIARRIATNHHGMLQVIQRGRGGACFVVVFPLVLRRLPAVD
ncbi:HAMP domain-containing histidine kinase [Saccharothrix syringae]|uniref:histidine kinase n=2 Tax=Saccharothrix syringae TaxID=103733 RepID=A0A5Q0HEP5_SACSY|nr:HAMP domain-containing histidine kinase [Saccharothrix syringae]